MQYVIEDWLKGDLEWTEDEDPWETESGKSSCKTWKQVAGPKAGQRALFSLFPTNANTHEGKKWGARRVVLSPDCFLSYIWLPARSSKQSSVGPSLPLCKTLCPSVKNIKFCTSVCLKKTGNNVPLCHCFARNSMSSFTMLWLRPYLAKRLKCQTATFMPMSTRSSFLDQQAKRSWRNNSRWEASWMLPFN